MKRVADGWQEISWQQAFDEVEQGIRAVQAKHGRHSVAFYAGNPTVHNMGAMMFVAPLMAGLHSKNKFSATSVDQLPHMLASLQMFGHQLLAPIPDVDHTDFMLMLGANPAASNGSYMTGGDIMGRIKKIQSRGGRVVVLDPRRTETAQQLGEHYFIKPASDVYFLSAILNVLFAENLVKLQHLDGQVHGLDTLKLSIAPFTPTVVAPLTGIPAEVITGIARDFAKASKAICYGRMGVCTQEYGGASAWLAITYSPSLQTFATGDSAFWDYENIIIAKEGTAAIPQRFYQYNVVDNVMTPFSSDWYFGGAALLGNKIWVKKLSSLGTVRWLYCLQSTALNLRRIMIY